MDTKNRTKEKNDYKRAHYKRIGLEVKKTDYEKLQAAAAAAGEPVNAYIKKAIAARMEAETGPDPAGPA